MHDGLALVGLLAEQVVLVGTATDVGVLGVVAIGVVATAAAGSAEHRAQHLTVGPRLTRHALLTRVERVAQAVADEVDAQRDRR